MKLNILKYIFSLSIIILSITAVQAQQTTQGKDFWLTFGDNYAYVVGTDNISKMNLQIRVVATAATPITLIFTDLTGDDHMLIPPALAAGEVYTLNLSDKQKGAVFLSGSSSGVSSKSLRIRSDEPITVYAMNQVSASTDATNVLPVNALGTDYYHISYHSQAAKDGYQIIATEDETYIYADNGSKLNTTPLSVGQVWTVYSVQNGSLTGNHITTNKPVAYFTTNGGSIIPQNSESNLATSRNPLYQQMFPVSTWGKKFCIPVTQQGVGRVRIVASQNDTHLTLQGGVIKTASGTGSTTLQQGQFVEVEVTAAGGGCFVTADKPVGVCSFMVASGYNSPKIGDPSIAWVSPVEQFIKEATVVPLTPSGTTLITAHYALLVVPTDGRDQTTLSIGGATPALVSGGDWTTSPNQDYSYYNLKLTNNASYTFANPKGLMLQGYGTGQRESYYYLATPAASAASGTHDLSAIFYVNDELYWDIDGKEYCFVNSLHIKAEIENASTAQGALKWFIDGDLQVTDQLEWDLDLASLQFGAAHTISMEVTDTNNKTKTYKTTIKLCPPMIIPVNQHYQN
jgi:hypothetical protein